MYRACILSTLHYSSKAWTTYSTQERRLNSYHLLCLRRILCISWQDEIPNTIVLKRAELPSIYTLLRANAIFAGWAMYAAWMTVGYPRIYCTVSCQQAPDLMVAQGYASKTPASPTWNLPGSVQCIGRSLLNQEIYGKLLVFSFETEEAELSCIANLKRKRAACIFKWRTISLHLCHMPKKLSFPHWPV